MNELEKLLIPFKEGDWEKIDAFFEKELDKLSKKDELYYVVTTDYERDNFEKIWGETREAAERKWGKTIYKAERLT